MRELRKQRLQQFARPQGVPGDLVELRRRDDARPSSLRRPWRRQPRRLLEQLSSGLGRATARRGTSGKLDRPGDLAVRRLRSACQVICALLLIVNHLSQQAMKLAPPRRPRLRIHRGRQQRVRERQALAGHLDHAGLLRPVEIGEREPREHRSQQRNCRLRDRGSHQQRIHRPRIQIVQALGDRVGERAGDRQLLDAWIAVALAGELPRDGQRVQGIAAGCLVDVPQQ